MKEWTTLKNADGKKGIRFREHPTRKHGKMPDRYYTMSYWWQGKTITEGIGWASEGWKPTACFNLFAELKKNQKSGQGPCTLTELRQEGQIRKAETERKRIADEKQNISFKTFFDEIYFPDAKLRWNHGTADSAMRHVKNWIDPVTGDTPMCELGIEHIYKIINKMSVKKRAPRTQQYVMRTFAMAWEAALDHKIVKEQCPTKSKSFRLPKVDNEKQRYLTEKEEETLFEEILKINSQAHNMATIAIDTGMRYGEIASLTWICVNTENQDIHVMNTKSKKDRHVPMTERVTELFKTMKRGATGQLVFPNGNGKEQMQIPTAFKRAMQRSGINNGITDKKMIASFHTLRHTYASRLVQAGVDLFRVQRLLGHSTPVMTARYSKLADTDLKEAVQKMERNKKPVKRGQVIQLFKK